MRLRQEADLDQQVAGKRGCGRLKCILLSVTTVAEMACSPPMQIQERQQRLKEDAEEEAKIAAECKRLADQQAAERAAEAERAAAATGGLVSATKMIMLRWIWYPLGRGYNGCSLKISKRFVREMLRSQSFERTVRVCIQECQSAGCLLRFQPGRMTGSPQHKAKPASFTHCAEPLMQGGRKQRQSEGGEPGIQIFVKPRKQAQQQQSPKQPPAPSPQPAAAAQDPAPKSPTKAQAAAASQHGADRRRPPSRQASGSLPVGPQRPPSSGMSHAGPTAAAAFLQDRRQLTDQRQLPGRRGSGALPPLPLLHQPQMDYDPQRHPAARDGPLPPPAAISEAQLAGLRSAAGDQQSGGSTGHGGWPAAQQQPQAATAGFQAAVAAEAAKATAALAAQVWASGIWNAHLRRRLAVSC